MNERGVIHRDLKPSHIGYDPESGNMKIIDYGCYIPNRRISEVLGYRFGTKVDALELEAFNFEKFDEKVDIYSAGVSLMMILGREILDILTLQKEFKSLKCRGFLR
jgi:serine/threonine protein kinase